MHCYPGVLSFSSLLTIFPQVCGATFEKWWLFSPILKYQDAIWSDPRQTIRQGPVFSPFRAVTKFYSHRFLRPPPIFLDCSAVEAFEATLSSELMFEVFARKPVAMMLLFETFTNQVFQNRFPPKALQASCTTPRWRYRQSGRFWVPACTEYQWVGPSVHRAILASLSCVHGLLVRISGCWARFVKSYAWLFHREFSPSEQQVFNWRRPPGTL